MEFSVDFFPYFRRMRTVLDADPSNYCVSAWNDNGRPSLASSPTQLYRSDCFPGMGWMLSTKMWSEEFAANWPRGFWDDWMREPTQRKGRSCIYPDVNRVYTFGEKGASAGQFFNQYLRDIKLNTELVDWDAQDLSFISSADSYRSWMRGLISGAKRVSSTAEARSAAAPETGEFVLVYESMQQLDSYLTQLNMMLDHKAGVPRTAFDGVLHFTPREGRRVWIVPRQGGWIQG